MKLVLASANAGKLVELRELLADLDVELVAQGELGVGEAEETGLTFVENALLKARHAAAATGRLPGPTRKTRPRYGPNATRLGFTRTQ